jgi:hypothetical protein
MAVPLDRIPDWTQNPYAIEPESDGEDCVMTDASGGPFKAALANRNYYTSHPVDLVIRKTLPQGVPVVGRDVWGDRKITSQPTSVSSLLQDV